MILRKFLSLVLFVALSVATSPLSAFAIHCDACGPYQEACQGVETYITLDGSLSYGNGQIAYAWSTDCPNADLVNPTTVAPTLILYNPGIGIPVSCKVYLSVVEQTVCECRECSCEDQCETTVVVPACNLDCAGTPNGNKVLDLCGVCGGDNSSCKGCDGVPNSGKVLDRCEVCDGDGNSCLGCSQVDILNTQFALDGNSLSQKGLIDYIAKLIVKTKGTSANKKYAAALKVQASKLYVAGWTLTWSLPNIVTTCSNQVFCTSTSNQVAINTFNNSSKALQDLLATSIKKLQKERRRKLGSDNRTLKKGLELHNRNLSLSATVPAQVSVCTQS